MNVCAVPRSRLDFAVQHGKHLTPIYEAARDFGCLLAMVPQGAGHFDPPPAGRPAIIILGDDLDQALGPSAFDEQSLRRLLKGVRLAAVVACEPLPRIYATAARHAVLLRKNVVIVETRPEHEIAWVNLIRSIAPDAAFLLGSVKGGEA
jgi:hypothetical protein